MCEKWTDDGNLIEVVSFFKYLGIYMTPKLSWSKTWGNGSSQAQKKQLLAYLDTRKHLVSLCHKIYLDYLIALLVQY